MDHKDNVDEKGAVVSASGHDSPPGYSPEGDGHTVSTGYIKPQARKLYDTSVTFEEYHYYAMQTREEEKHLVAPDLQWLSLITGKFKQAAPPEVDGHDTAGAARRLSQVKYSDVEGRLEISDEEWTNASRAFRSAGWGAAFFLITTDIIGPYGVSYSLGTLGWGPGIALYSVFGFFAGYSGYLLWHTFLGLDSYEFPCKNYGDLAFRTWGSVARHVTNVVQALGLLLILGQVTIQYGENISEMSKFRLCYAVCPLLFVIAGFFMTQIRTLKNFGIFANLSVWLILLSIFITMGVIAHTPPNYQISVLGSAGGAVDPTTIKPVNGVYPSILHYGGTPPGAGSLVAGINGLLTGVLAYAGAQLFVEFMAEMRRPRDFLKAMWGAQFLIYATYMIYGTFVYHYQGQYTFDISYQGISLYGWQTVGNALSLLSALIAAGLYGNIGIKVVYNNILIDIFKAPPLITKKGKILYAIIVPIWWSIAYVVAAAIPDYIGFVSVVSASTLLNLTYTLPPFFAIGYDIQQRAIAAGEGFDPSTGKVVRYGTQMRRFVRGFLAGGPLRAAQTVFHVIYFLASLSMCGLGMYAAIEGLIVAYAIPQVNAFTCVSPLNIAAAQAAAGS